MSKLIKQRDWTRWWSID